MIELWVLILAPESELIHEYLDYDNKFFKFSTWDGC